MRKLLLSLFVFSSSLAFAQTSVYHPFPATYGFWAYQYHDDFGVPTPFITNYFLNGDTVINSTTYKKIFLGPNYAGGLRENSRIIYFVPDTSALNTEYVLYDFNLTVGDTIIHPFNGAVCSNDTVTINSVDSILCSDGYHRQLWLSSFAVWIEGIGSRAYLLHPAQLACISGNDVLFCMTGDSGLVFPQWGSCTVSTSETSSTPSLTLSPNPSGGEFVVRCPMTDDGRLEIFNVLGERVYSASVIGRQSSVNLNLPSGIYFLKLTTPKGALFSQKLVIE